MEEKNNILGDYIARRLELSGLQQTDLAKHLGLSKTFINQWIRGSAYPPPYHIARLAQYLGVSVTDIIDRLPSYKKAKYKNFFATARQSTAKYIHSERVEFVAEALSHLDEDQRRKFLEFVEIIPHLDEKALDSLNDLARLLMHTKGGERDKDNSE